MERGKPTIVFELKMLDNLLHKAIDASIRAVDTDEQMTRMHHWIIGYLHRRQGEDVFQRDVEAEFRISRSTTSSMITLMEKKGLIRRESVPGDARLKKLTLTDKAVEMHRLHIGRFQAVESRVEQALTEEEREELIRLLHKIRDQVAASETQTETQTEKEPEV